MELTIQIRVSSNGNISISGIPEGLGLIPIMGIMESCKVIIASREMEKIRAAPQPSIVPASAQDLHKFQVPGN